MKKGYKLSRRLSAIFIGGMGLSILAGGITTYIVQDKIVDDLTNARLKNSVYESSKVVQDTLLKAEITVEDAEYITETEFTTSEQLAPTHKTEIDASLEKIHALYELPANHYPSVCSYWLTLNPAYTGLTSEAEHGDGFFYVRKTDGTFENVGATNVLKYEEDDVEHIGWWISVRDNKQPLWIDPYYNANVGNNMISYVRPFFSSSNEFLGAVGVDIDFMSILNSIKSFDEYKDAHSILLNAKDEIIFHTDLKSFDDEGRFIGTNTTLKEMTGIVNFKESETGAIIYRYKGHRRNAMSISLKNGLVYGVSVRTGELRRPLRMIVFIPQLVYITAASLLVFGVLMLVRKHILPLKELNAAIQEVENGKMDIEIKAKNNDEIGNLATSFSNMVASLKEKNRMITAMAFLDGLTGVKNKNAHRETVRRLEKQIQEGTAKFAVVMLDVNNLKVINDNEGHEGGDKAIIGSCYSLCKAFSHSPVYRIGGDEFVAIVETDDYENRQEIYDKLRKNEIEVKNVKYDFAVGMATYEPGVDTCFKDVFTRADEEMYKNKKARKNNG